MALDRAGDVHLVHHWCPGGISATPQLAEFVRYPPGAVATARNRNTVENLIAALGA